MAMRPTVIVTNKVHDSVLERLSAVAAVEANDTHAPWTTDSIATRARPAAGVLAFMPDCFGAELADACPHLRIVAAAAKGVDNFDGDALAARGVWLSNVPDLLTDPTAELAIGLAIGLLRHVSTGDRRVRSGMFGGWQPVLYGGTLTRARVGVVGMGPVGQAIVRRLAGYDAEIAFVDPDDAAAEAGHGLGAARMEFAELLALSDVLFVAAPLSAASRHLLDDRALAALPAGASVINVGRGSVVDEAAVARALHADTLAGYAADVFEFEDWALPDRPRSIHPDLLAQPDRTLFTPHIGSAVAAIREQIELAAADNIIDVLEGRPPRGAVNRPHAPRPVAGA